jgi:hypothetical protein
MIVQWELLATGACQRMVAVDGSQARIKQARANMPPELAGRLEFVHASLDDWTAPDRFDLILSSGGLGAAGGVDTILTRLRDALTPDGLLYVDDFVGPARSALNNGEIKRINNLLDEISDGRDVGALLSTGSNGDSSPLKASLDGTLAERLHAAFDTVEEHRWGRAVVAQLYDALVGDVPNPANLVAAMMRVDQSLSADGATGRDYLWGVYRAQLSRARTVVGEPEIDGRLDALDASCVVGWAADRSDLGARLSVDLLIDHKLVAKTVADLPRPDLAREGIGDGAHAFRFELPDWVLDGREHTISVLVPAFGMTVAPAHGWAQRSLALPSRTGFAWARHDPDLAPLPTGRVLAGRDGWAFSCDDAVGTLEQLLGRLALTAPDLQCWRTVLERSSRELAALGIPYLVAIVPSKAAVHPERLPPSSPPVGPPKLARQLIEAVSDGDPHVADLLPPLLDAARAGAQQYYKRDTELNYNGAWTVARTLINAIQQRNVAVRELQPDAVRIKQEALVGTLSGKPAVALDDGRLRLVPATSAPEVARLPNEDALMLDRGPQTATAAAQKTTIIESRADRPTALIVHDRHARVLAPFLAVTFGRSVWTAGRAIEPELIEQHHPSVVVQVLDESQLVRVPYELAGLSIASAPSSR